MVGRRYRLWWSGDGDGVGGVGLWQRRSCVRSW